MTDPRLAALAAAYRHGPGKSISVPPRPPRVARPCSGAGIDLRRLAERGAFGTRLARMLRAALAPRRWEPWNVNNDHRAYPSARSGCLTDAALLIDDQRWVVDPVRLILEGEAPLPAAISSAHVELSTHPERLPPGYGDLRVALGLLEAGHVTSALVEAGSAAGLVPAARAITTGAMDGLVAEVALHPGAPATAVFWPQVLAGRSSGLNPLGFAADPRALAGDLLRRLVSGGRCVPAGSLAGQPGADQLRHRLVISRVVGIPPGLYQLRDGDLRRCDTDAITQRLQSAIRYGPEDIDVSSMNVVWVITADLTAESYAHGSAGYPRALLAAGASAQHVCTAAAAAGLFCRPMRSYDEAAVEAAVGADPGEDVLYLLLIGRPRAYDFCYDLTSTEEPKWE
ncbi:MAG TPA: nitroreductase family protein [Micromonosporaceae bacterium]|nr:nitroreductase family protein [Micromonosporaceae bacterium]